MKNRSLLGKEEREEDYSMQKKRMPKAKTIQHMNQ
jgi:hypothetical protein